MRTFVAFTLPDEVANQIASWAQENKPEGVFLEPGTNLHMTLAFLGDTPEELVQPINNILSQLDPASVSINGPIKYEEQAKLAFLTYEEIGGSEVWEQLNAELKQLMGYEPQFRPWLPHTTVWRFAPDHKPNVNPPLPQLSFSPTAVTLYQSVRNEGGGATYQHVSNIFDPIEVGLDQRIFDGTDLRRSIQKFIQRVYYHALDHKLGVVGTKWADLYLTGSLTTYQYSKTSDADVSVFPDYEYIYKHLNIDPQSARRMLIEMSINYLDGTFLPGTHHPLQFFVVPYGILPGDLYRAGLRSAYNLLDHHWLVPPERSRSHDVQRDMPEAYQRAADIAEKMTVMLDAGDYNTARELWHSVHAKRQLDQRAGLGDYSEGNIVYKWLLHEGLFDRIRSELNEYIAKTAEWNGNVDTLWRIFDATYMNTPHRDREETRERNMEFAGWVGLDPQEAKQQFDLWKYDRDKTDVKNEQKIREIQEQQEKWRLEGDEQMQKMIAEHGDEAYEIMHRFDSLEPPDAPQFEGDKIDMVEYAVTQGWTWKFIISRGHGAWVWADSETHDYGGIAPHSEMMVELMNSGEMPKPDPKNMALGWIEKPALEDGDHPYEALVRGGDGFTDDEIRQYLTLTPADIVSRSGGSMVLQWYGKAAGVEHLWDDRVTTKIIYDFDKDRIVLGTQADIPNMTGSNNKIVGEYDDGKVTLFEADKQWINPGYFRRLWHVSYPERHLKDVYFRRETGDEYKLKSLPRGRKKKSATDTGDPVIDSLLNMFKQEKFQHVKGHVSVDDLKDPKIANGLCHTLAASFANFMTKQGYEAWLPKRGTGTPEAFGYEDRTIKGHAGHYWTYVKSGDDTYGIDWTAAQYGYDEVPVVQRLTDSGWEREWDNVAIR